MSKSTPSGSFWERLCEAARSNGIEPTQTEIASKLGVRQSAVAKWKAGGHPKMSRLEEIARRWQFNINWLLTGEGPKRPPGVGELDETSELLRIWRSLNMHSRKAMLEYAKVMQRAQSATSPADRSPADRSKVA